MLEIDAAWPTSQPKAAADTVGRLAWDYDDGPRHCEVSLSGSWHDDL